MGTPKVLQLALALLSATLSAASWEEDLSRCSTECAFSGDPKLKYDLGKIYSYSYSVKSEVKVALNSTTETEWSNTLEMTWITPCDMAIKFNNTRIDGIEDPADSGALERYPLIVALIDGRVQHVCSHPDDDVWAVNLKKGVASAIQNSLSSLSATDSPLTILETDVVGRCPTLYETEIEESKMIVRKEKNHKDCQKSFSPFTEISMAWLLASVSVQESNCQQEITNGLYTTIVCEDKKVVILSHEDNRHVHAYQKLTLQLQSESFASSSNTASNSQTEMVQGSLLYDHTVKKDPSLVAQLDETMSQICEKTMGIIESDVASLLVNAVQLMHLVPEAAVEQTLEKIRSGHFCPDYRKLESIFLDSVAFSLDSSAVEVLVKELISGAATEDRASLYAQSLCFISRPNTFAIEALKPLMEASQSLSTAILCGASMVNEFCQNNHQCQEEESVRSIVNILSDKLEEQCSSLHDEETRTLVTLKALGNMGVITPEVSSSVIECVESQEIDDGVSVAAVQSLRNAECGHIPTEKIADFALNSSVNTEVRIASYLAVIQCAGEAQLQRIISGMIKEENTQVRGFILSQIVNLQESDISFKDPLKNLLSNVILPDDFEEVDITKMSRNVDISFSAPSLGVKANIESNILYTPESYVPRNLNVNVTTDIRGSSMNMVEIGARLEGLEPFFDIILETGDGYLHHGRRTQSEKPRIEAFLRVLGQEIYFASKSGDPRKLYIDSVIRQFSNYFEETISKFLSYVASVLDNARAVQFQKVYSLPTTQGIPFKLQFEIAVVLGITLDGFQNIFQIPSASGNRLKIQPIFSVHLNRFIGYDSHLIKEGISIVTNISNNNNFAINAYIKSDSDFKIQLDIPDEVEVISVVGQLLLMKKRIGLFEQNHFPEESFRHSVSCFRKLRSLLGLDFCSEFLSETVQNKSHIPFGVRNVIKVYIEKIDQTLKAYRLRVVPDDRQGNGSGMIIQAEVVGDLVKHEMTIQANHIVYENGHEMITLLLDSSNNTSGIWLSKRISRCQMTLEGIMKLKFNDHSVFPSTEIYEGLKIDLAVKGRSLEKGKHRIRIRPLEERVYTLKMYHSKTKNYPQESQLLGVKMTEISNGEKTNLNLQVKILDSIRSRNGFSLEAGVDLKQTRYRNIDMPSRIRKFEILGKFERWEVESFIRKKNESAHESLFIIHRSGTKLLAIRSFHNAKESWQQEDAALRTAITVISRGDLVFEVFNEIFYGYNRTGMTLEVLRPSDCYKMAEFVAFL